MWLFKLFMLVVAKSQLQHLADGRKGEWRDERTSRQSSYFNKLSSGVIVLLLYTCSLEGDKGFTTKQGGNLLL